MLIAWQYSTMVKRKSKLSGKKRASKHGGGCRAPPKVMTAPPQPAAAISAVTSGSDSDDSELNMNPAAKASKAVAGASPRASSLATPRASEVPSRAPSPPPARLTSGEKELRKQLKRCAGRCVRRTRLEAWPSDPSWVRSSPRAHTRLPRCRSKGSAPMTESTLGNRRYCTLALRAVHSCTCTEQHSCMSMRMWSVLVSYWLLLHG